MIYWFSRFLCSAGQALCVLNGLDVIKMKEKLSGNLNLLNISSGDEEVVSIHLQWFKYIYTTETGIFFGRGTKMN